MLPPPHLAGCSHIPDPRALRPTPYTLVWPATPISCRSGMQMARRVGFAAFGVFNGTEENPNFHKGGF